jgi:hypothetical protein
VADVAEQAVVKLTEKFGCLIRNCYYGFQPCFQVIYLFGTLKRSKL